MPGNDIAVIKGAFPCRSGDGALLGFQELQIGFEAFLCRRSRVPYTRVSWSLAPIAVPVSAGEGKDLE